MHCIRWSSLPVPENGTRSFRGPQPPPCTGRTNRKRKAMVSMAQSRWWRKSPTWAQHSTTVNSHGWEREAHPGRGDPRRTCSWKPPSGISWRQHRGWKTDSTYDARRSFLVRSSSAMREELRFELGQCAVATPADDRPRKSIRYCQHQQLI